VVVLGDLALARWPYDLDKVAIIIVVIVATHPETRAELPSCSGCDGDVAMWRWRCGDGDVAMARANEATNEAAEAASFTSSPARCCCCRDRRRSRGGRLLPVA